MTCRAERDVRIAALTSTEPRDLAGFEIDVGRGNHLPPAYCSCEQAWREYPFERSNLALSSHCARPSLKRVRSERGTCVMRRRASVCSRAACVGESRAAAWVSRTRRDLSRTDCGTGKTSPSAPTRGEQHYEISDICLVTAFHGPVSSLLHPTHPPRDNPTPPGTQLIHLSTVPRGCHPTTRKNDVRDPRISLMPVHP